MVDHHVHHSAQSPLLKMLYANRCDLTGSNGGAPQIFGRDVAHKIVHLISTRCLIYYLNGLRMAGLVCVCVCAIDVCGAQLVLLAFLGNLPFGNFILSKVAAILETRDWASRVGCKFRRLCAKYVERYWCRALTFMFFFFMQKPLKAIRYEFKICIVCSVLFFLLSFSQYLRFCINILFE